MFQPGETVKAIPITLTDDAAYEGNETVVVVLSGATTASLGAARVAFTSDVPFDKSRAVEVLAGALAFGSPFTQTGGSTTLNGGTISGNSLDILRWAHLR